MVKPKILKVKPCLTDAVDVCPVDVFKKTGNTVRVVNPQDCIGCMQCSRICDGIVVE